MRASNNSVTGVSHSPTTAFFFSKPTKTKTKKKIVHFKHLAAGSKCAFLFFDVSACFFVLSHELTLRCGHAICRQAAGRSTLGTFTLLVQRWASTGGMSSTPLLRLSLNMYVRRTFFLRVIVHCSVKIQGLSLLVRVDIYLALIEEEDPGDRVSLFEETKKARRGCEKAIGNVS